MAAILRVKDESGNVYDIPAVVGPAGPQGERGPAGEAGRDGAPGKEGYTPVRGVDYFTETDVAAMVDAVASRFENGDTEAY